ncbi:hypothetical protein GCM10009760_28930 [Kitasatospora kazusensis]|uniref:DUF397 domain-containing protein n=1 Tax=Kitasatospora kazusensis TaxID=407974 RepID=A0ABP5L7M6_9ACTN
MAGQGGPSSSGCLTGGTTSCSYREDGKRAVELPFRLLDEFLAEFLAERAPRTDSAEDS